MQWLHSFKNNNGIIWLACNVTQDCYQFIKLFQKSVHMPWLCRVFMNCTSPFVLRNCFNVCIQVLTGKFWAGMQDYLIPTPTLDGGVLLFSPGGPPAFGTLRCSCGLQKSQGKAEKQFCHCAGWKAALPSAAGMGTEGSDTARNNGTDCAVPGAPCCWMAQSHTSEVLWTFGEPISHLKYCQKLSFPF